MLLSSFGKVRARGDVLGFDGGAGLGDGVERSVDARLDVQLAGRGDEQPHLALADDLDDPLTHGKAGSVEVLAGVGHAGVGRVGVVGHHGDPGVQRLLHGFVERLEIDE